MKNKSSIAYIAIFIVAVVTVGLLSFKNLVDFYVNDEVDYNEWSVNLGSKFETDIATTFFQKMQFVNLNGAIHNLLKQHEMNGVIKLENGYLLTTIPFVDDEILQGYVNKVLALNEYLEKRGTKLVYVMTPYTSGKYDPQLPQGYLDYGNDNADRLMRMIEGANIDAIDFRETMYDDGIDHYSMMYKTDHHWNTEAGFYAYGVLENYIIENIGCDVDDRISDQAYYSLEKYPKWHLGSRGQRTGRYYAGIDDFDLYIPNFEISIQNDAGDVGTVQDIIINREPLQHRDYSSRYTYDTVLGKAVGHYMNLESENDVKILMVSDSFSKAVNPFLIMGFAEVNYVYDGDVSCITPSYIESYDPDVVILMYYTENAVNASAYNFQEF